MADIVDRLLNEPVSVSLCNGAADEIESLQARINELEYFSGMDKADIELKLVRIAELEERPGFHHPDCNWWKWDWRYSWDKTDCNCVDVAGPSLNHEDQDNE